MKQTTQYSLVTKMMKTKSREKTYEDFPSEKIKTSGSPLNTTFQKLIRLNNGRKFQPLEERETLLGKWKRKSINDTKNYDRLELIRSSLEKESSLDKVERNTYHSTSGREKGGSSRMNNNPAFTRNRTKHSLDLTQANGNEELVVNNLRLKLQNRIQKLNSKKEHLNLFKKKSKEFAQLTTDYKHLQEPSLVHLISKFKFENLKTASGLSEPQQLIEIKRKEHYFPATFSEGKQEKRHKVNKTVVKFYNHGQNEPKKVTRKVSILTPWQMDAKDGNSIDFF